ncbi:ComEC/Rec2 family competence protein [Chryseobacterium sp. PMSZPI]|uniref:ComEC/Rec2 family competence protein n=1 Tax=Chryseobacterium sp. PMSZPI TaxID=1033900 RepID=UPI00267F4F4E
MAICFILGILFQDKFLLDQTAVYSIAVVSVGILISIFFHSYFLFKIKAVLLGLLFFGMGIILHFYNTFPTEGTEHIQGKQMIVFKISRKLNSTGKYKKYEGVVEVKKQYFNSIFYIPKTYKELDFKHYYKVEAYIAQPKPPQYDFQFDYAKYLKRKDIENQCYISKEISSVERNDLHFTDKVRQSRLEVLNKIDKAKMSGKSKEFLKGIILADRTEIDQGTARDFNRSGLVHLLAISGTHIVVIFGMFYFLLVRIIPLRLRKYSIIVSLIFIWLFAGFIGFGNSVLRACIMLSVYFVFILLQRKPDMLHSLALSAFIILLLDTRQLFDIGFQLSFLAVLGIFWLNQPLLKYFPVQDNYFKKLLFNTITISLSAQLATLPFVLYYFHQFSLISIIANFVIVPASEMIIVFSFLITTLIAFKIDFDFINRIYDIMIQWLLKVIHWFAEIDGLFFENISMHWGEVLLVLIVVYLLRAVIFKFNFKNSVRLGIAILTFLIIRTSITIIENNRDEILIYTFNKKNIFSVKKGDRACFWVSDMKDQDKLIRYVVGPYCTSRRIQSFEIKPFPSGAEKVVFQDEIYEIK